MRLTTAVAALVGVLAPVYCYQPSSLGHESLIARQILLRRNPMLGQPRDRSRSPPRASISSSLRIHGPLSPFHSDGDSDSSQEGGRRSKTKLTATGPADVSWKSSTPGRPRQYRKLEQDEKFKKSVRGGGYGMSEMEVHTHSGNPAGQAKMTARGSKKVNVRASADSGATGTNQDITPGEESPLHAVVPDRAVQINSFGEPDSVGARRVKATVDGPGRIKGEAFDHD